MKLAAGKGHSTATDFADWLVLELGLPFREAHHVTGRIVALADAKGVELKALSLADFQSVEPQDHQGRVFRPSMSQVRSKAGKAMAERPPLMCGMQANGG